RRKLYRSLRSRAQQTLDYQLLATCRAAVDPKRNTGVRRRIKRCMLYVNGLVGIVGNCYRDGICSRMNRVGIAVVQGGPAPVLPPVLQRVGVNLLVTLPKKTKSLAR